MLFSSLNFLFAFLPMTLLGYFAVQACTGKSKRPIFFLNLVLLIASLYFYHLGEPKYFWVMLVVGFSDFFFARLMGEKGGERSDRYRKMILWASVLVNMGFLFYFKYAQFFYFSLQSLSSGVGSASYLDQYFLNVALPVGISFYTFESMSYIIDVYRGETTPSKDPVSYWSFISFFPHLIAGPIIRYVDLRDQLQSRVHSYEKAQLGVRIFVVGLAKKVIIANPMGFYADYLFALNPSELDTVAAWFAAVTYTLQIYFDFSGYSDMAIGLALIFGIQLPQNFNYPYVSQSIQEFWRRWHMTLSSWFRDYVYIPLGGNRRGPWIEYRNLFLVFTLCGLWHGASWNFLLWGFYHGFFLVFERVLGFSKLSLPQWFRHIYALVVIVFGWVLFRVEEMDRVLGFWKTMLGGGASFISTDSLTLLAKPHFVVFASLGLMLSLPLKLWLGEARQSRLLKGSGFGIELVYILMFLMSVVLLCGEEYNPFIYFRF